MDLSKTYRHELSVPQKGTTFQNCLQKLYAKYIKMPRMMLISSA